MTTTTKSTKAASTMGREDGREAAQSAYSDACSGIATPWRSEDDAASGWDEHSGEAASWRMQRGALRTDAERRAYAAAYADAARTRATELYREANA